MQGNKVIRDKLQDPSAFTTSLTTVVLDRLGTEALGWHPMTIRMELLDEFNVPVPKVNLDKIYTGIGLLSSDDFYHRLPVFMQYCNILSGGQFNPARLDLADADECAWGITEAVLLSPPEDDENSFADDIRYYVGGVLNDEGIRNPPDVLRIGKWEKPTFGELSTQDPFMFQMENDAQTEESEQIKKMLRTRLEQLVQEVSSLPLENGSASDLLEKMTTK